MCVRLHKQEVARGLVSKDCEFVVERVVQDAKDDTGRLISKHPEKVLVNRLMLGRALRSLKAQFPGIENEGSNVGLMAHVGAGGTGLQNAYRGESDVGAQARFLGKGDSLSGKRDVREPVQSSVRRYVNGVKAPGWTTSDVLDSFAIVGKAVLLSSSKGCAIGIWCRLRARGEQSAGLIFGSRCGGNQAMGWSPPRCAGS